MRHPKSILQSARRDVWQGYNQYRHHLIADVECESVGNLQYHYCSRPTYIEIRRGKQANDRIRACLGLCYSSLTVCPHGPLGVFF